MGLFERYLSVWIGLAIVVGVGLGAWFPDAAASIAALKAAVSRRWARSCRFVLALISPWWRDRMLPEQG